MFGVNTTTKRIDGLLPVQTIESRTMFRLEIGLVIGQEDIMVVSQVGDLKTMVTKTIHGIRK